MALVNAWTVFGFLRTNSIGAYRQPAGSGAPQTALRALWGAGIGDNFHRTVLLQLGHHRVNIGDRIDLPALERGNRAGPGTDSYDGYIRRLEPLPWPASG